MNECDKKIVVRLMTQARSTWAELGALLNLSAPAAAERVRKMEENGVIKGYAAIVTPEAVGCNLTAFISVNLDRTEQKTAFINQVNNLPEVLECHHMAGAEDYVLKVRCAGTRDLERVISEEIKALPGIKTRTTIILSTLKETTVLPVK